MERKPRKRCGGKRLNLMKPNVYPNIKDIAPTEITDEFIESFNIHKIRRDQLFNYKKEVIKKTRLEEYKVVIKPEYPKIVRKVTPHVHTLEDACNIPIIPCINAIKRGILKRIVARGLVKKYPKLFSNLLTEVLEEYKVVTHSVSIMCTVKPLDESVETHLQLQCYNFLGRTSFRSKFIRYKNYLQEKLLITHPFIRDLKRACVENLPSCTIDISKFRFKPITLGEIEENIDQEINQRRFALARWHDSILTKIGKGLAVPSNLKLKYLKTGTGLLSIHLSSCTQEAVESFIRATQDDDTMPNFQMSLYYNKKICLDPSKRTTCHTFIKFLNNLLNLASDLGSLESFYSDRYKGQLIPINISTEMRKRYIKLLRFNIAKRFEHISNHIRSLNKDLKFVYSEREWWEHQAPNVETWISSLCTQSDDDADEKEGEEEEEEEEEEEDENAIDLEKLESDKSQRSVSKSLSSLYIDNLYGSSASKELKLPQKKPISDDINESGMRTDSIYGSQLPTSSDTVTLPQGKKEYEQDITDILKKVVKIPPLIMPTDSLTFSVKDRLSLGGSVRSSDAIAQTTQPLEAEKSEVLIEVAEIVVQPVSNSEKQDTTESGRKHSAVASAEMSEFILDQYADTVITEQVESPQRDITFDEGFAKVDCYMQLLYKLHLMFDLESFAIGTLLQTACRENLAIAMHGMLKSISEKLISLHIRLNEDITDQFLKLSARSRIVPKTTAELMEMGEYMLWASTVYLTELQERIHYSISMLLKLVDISTLTNKHMYLNQCTINWLTEVKLVIERNATMFEACRFDYEEFLQKTVYRLQDEFVEFEKRLLILDELDDVDNAREYLTPISSLLVKIREFEKLKIWINKEQVLFKAAISQFPEIQKYKNHLYPFHHLVQVCTHWRRCYQAWMDGPLEFLNSSDSEELVDDFMKEFLKARKVYKNVIKQARVENEKIQFGGILDDPEPCNLPAPLRLAAKGIDQLKDFRPNLNMMSIMCNDALLQRHWDEMSEIAGYDLTPTARTTLRKLLNMGLEPDLDKYEMISSGAIKERQLLQNLLKMQAEWENIYFKTSVYKDTGINILTQLDDIQVVLDDHIIKALTMRGSVFVKPYEPQVRAWYDKINRVNATIDEWGKVQAQWLYLLPIFSSKDIVSQMPEEGNLFKEVDGTYRRYMGAAVRQPLVLETAGSMGLLENFQNCSLLLERINDGVTAYLERKRLYFPRFFFLSNDEMLEILSETKDPLRVQPHLRKCFEGVHRLHFDSSLQIHAMFSEEKERINFLSIINTEEARGSVEKWLVQVETQMLASVREEIIKSRDHYEQIARTDWVVLWPGQVVLAVSQIYWTTNVHTALGSSETNAVKKFISSLTSDLQEIVTLVRNPTISNLARITIKALIVIDVHAKDVVQDLYDKNVKSDTEFKWLAQLRYYWEEECIVRIINAGVNYAYEYLGNSDRLVITPLTDRCYRTLVGAYHLHLNGAPEGPAGTGKTETTKDLAKALAVQCVVFNCSDGLDYKAMGKFFKGLASSGAWACFDEFNRIEVEVLSVVAQQILCIVVAVRAHAEKFMFEGTELRLKATCYVCITMNPGYAGRSELPDNLKVLFRTVAMMVPDYAMIGEISLYSYGFTDARVLSVKIVTVYRLCSEQLSSQNHYDYGMRAVKTVLSACGNNKSKFPNENEDILLLRSIIDVNLPKFLNHDIPLFDGIISDLFPGVSLPPADYDKFIECVKESCTSRNLQVTDSVIIKIIQTYEMMIVRHGFMLVGESFAGKTSTLKVLADTLKSLGELGYPQVAVQYQFINPKAVTMGQLYGQFDPVSYEWFDGVVATCFRRFVQSESPERKWVIFDGPVDAVWIENMNTVLDDNKKLCLMSGEVMAMTNVMSMIFEVQDLAQASPATVSRCGMIYMEPGTLGWRPHVESWLPTCKSTWRESNEDLIFALFDWLIPPCLYFIRKYCRALCHAGEINLVKSMMNIVEITLTDACTKSEKKEEDPNIIIAWVEAAHIYAGIWGLGGILDTDSRVKFDEYYSNMWRGLDENNPYPPTIEKLDVTLPGEGLFFDYLYLFKGKGTWKYWPDLAREQRVEDAPNIQQVIIPTVETLRYMFLIELYIQYRCPILLIGPTGTGKSFYMQDLLMNKLNQDLFEPAFVTFTVKISANQTQDLIISKLFKRRRGNYGAPKGKLSVIFIDDLNMPIKEVYGAQPPIELVRQYFDHKNWYDLKDTSIIYLHDILFTAAMGPPGGSRQEVYARFLRHFSILSINEFTEDTMSKIFCNLLLVGLKRNGFPSDVILYVQQIVSASIDVYKQCVLNLRPTPAKSHYVFNLRDISRIIFGCGMLKKESAENKQIFARIWVHEVLRVVYDRLIETKDKQWLFNKLKLSVRDFFKENFDRVFETLDIDSNEGITDETLKSLMFGTYVDLDASEEEQKYEEITNNQLLLDVGTTCLEEYNSTHKTKMNVVLFKYALEHLSKICRVMIMPCGSALLIGISGSGRQSLTKLATQITGHTFFQPEITKNYGMNEWRDDIKRMVKEAGGRGKHSVFLFTEGQIKEEGFLQDVDCLLNAGEVPNIFPIDEKQEILEMTRLAAQGGNKNLDVSALKVFSFFTKRTREKLHIILCFSPVGAALRTRLRLYPSLVNCCTIDWFEDWPEDSLEKVAENWMEDINLPPEVKSSAVVACKYFHIIAREVSEKFFLQTCRKSYITSASYLELIRSFTLLTNARQGELIIAKRRYIIGLERLELAAEAVSQMQVALEELQPELKIMSAKAVEMMKQIEKETKDVEICSGLVKKDEEVANAQAAEAQALKAECEADLADALPILEEALAALNTLKPADITLVKSMKNPPAAVKLVLAGVCVIKGFKPDRVPDPSTGRMGLDYWGPSKRILGDINFLQSLKDFDKDNIPIDIMAKIRKEYLPHPDFKPQIIAKASTAAEGLCKWIIAMDMYDKVAKVVAPKKAKLAMAERSLAATMAILNEKKQMVENLEGKLADLNVLLEEASEKQMQLQFRVDMCASKLSRAKKLIGGLGGEKSRWIIAANNLQAQYDSLAGDILLSCAAISYLSPFTINWRQDTIKDWLRQVQVLKIPASHNYDFCTTLGSEIKIQNWYIAGLPRDAFSTENAIIQDNSKRWSLLIDPQSQANLWIRKLEQKNQLKITKFSDGNYMKLLEKCVETGKPALIENIEEDLEAPLDPLLAKNTFRQAGITVIALGDNVVPYNANFKLYLTSKLRNPHYLPEVFNKVTIINFALTIGGLADQLLGITVQRERPKLQAKREELIKEGADNKKALADVEELILKTLSETKGDILENESAVEILDHSKILSADILKKQAAAKETEEKIEVARLTYKPISDYSSILYYCISDLPNVDPMYQYSLKWFINLFISSIDGTVKSRDIDKRIRILRDHFTYNLYSNVCRSLFEKDKLMFSFLLCIKIRTSQNLIDEKELAFLLTGGIAVENTVSNPASVWLSTKSWNEICRLEQFKAFEGFMTSFSEQASLWQKIYDTAEPQNCIFPSPWETKLSEFQKLLVIRALRLDKIKVSIAKYVKQSMGEQFTIPPPFDIAKSFMESSCVSPLVFILSAGTDPMGALLKFAETKGFTAKFHCISLGQGQGPFAQALIEQGQEEGSWVCLQNCHLAVSWMQTLENLCDKIDPQNTHLHFRLWLTSYPSDKFPVSILENGAKMTNEPPTGLQQNLLRSYLNDPVKNLSFFSGCPGRELMFTRLLYGIAFFHAVIQERRSFGPLGWNIPYGFNESDFDISVQQLQMFINEYKDNPYEGVCYLTGECNYGGRVTDDWDRRLIVTILADYLNPRVATNMSYQLSNVASWYNIPTSAEYQHYIDHIEKLPQLHSPEVFGLHVNAGIARDLQISNALLNSVILVRGEGGAGGGQEDQLLKMIASDILSKLPKNFDIEAAKEKFPVDYNESMNTVLVQEMERFTKLLNEVRSSLQTILKAIEGLVVMTPALEALSSSLLLGRIPAAWAKVSYPSLKTLPNYVSDFVDRIKFLQAWFLDGKPNTFWLSGFFFTQAFLTGAKQNYARKFTIPIDQLTYDFEVLRVLKISEAAPDGVYVYGIFTDGARWNREQCRLEELFPKILNDSVPLMWIKPILVKDYDPAGRYLSPLYKTSERRGTLSTTGHSTNYVLPILLNTNIDPSHWIKRSVALLCQLD